jgi:hypothetical protein
MNLDMERVNVRSLTMGEAYGVFSYVLIMDMFNSGLKWEGLLRGKFRYCLSSDRC